MLAKSDVQGNSSSRNTLGTWYPTDRSKCVQWDNKKHCVVDSFACCDSVDNASGFKVRVGGQILLGTSNSICGILEYQSQNCVGGSGKTRKLESNYIRYKIYRKYLSMQWAANESLAIYVEFWKKWQLRHEYQELTPPASCVRKISSADYAHADEW